MVVNPKKNGLMILGLFFIFCTVATVFADDMTNNNYLFSASSEDYSYEVKATSDNNIIFFDNVEGTVPWSHNVGRGIKAIALSSDGRYIVVSCDGGLLILFNREGGISWRRTFPGESITTITISKDNSFIDLITADNQILYLTLSGNQIDGITRGVSQATTVPTGISTTIPTPVLTRVSTPSPVPTSLTTPSKPTQNNKPTSFTQNFIFWIVFGLIAFYVLMRLVKRTNKTTTSLSPLYPRNGRESQKTGKTPDNARTPTTPSSRMDSHDPSQKPVVERKTFPKKTGVSPEPNKIPKSIPSPLQPPVIIIDTPPIRKGEPLPSRNIAESAKPVKMILEPDFKNSVDENLFEPLYEKKSDPQILPQRSTSQKTKPKVIIKEDLPSVKRSAPDQLPPQKNVVRVESDTFSLQQQTERREQAQEKFNIGNTLFELGRYSEALSSFNQAADLLPDYPEASFSRGETLIKLGRYEEAVTSFDKCVDLNPENAPAWNRRGIALYYLGRYPEALNSYNKAIEIDPEFTEAYLNRGNVQNVRMQYSDAVTSFDRVLDMRPNDATVWYNRGIALQNLKKNSEALQSFDKTIEFSPRHTEALFQRGNALRTLGKYPDAVASFDKMIETAPGDAVAWYFRGMALEESGELNAALLSYENALRLKPNYSAVKQNHVAVLRKIQRKKESEIASPPKDTTVRRDSIQTRDEVLPKKSEFTPKPNNPVISRWNVPPNGEIILPEPGEETTHERSQQYYGDKGSSSFINSEKFCRIKTDTQKVQALLGTVFAADEDSDLHDQNNSFVSSGENSPVTEPLPVNYKLPFPDEILKSLDPKYHPLLAQIAGRTDMSKDELRKIIRESHLMYDATMTDINTWSDEVFDDFLLEEEPKEDRIKINMKGL